MKKFFKLHYQLLFLICIVLVGGFLRFYQIDKDPPGLYMDEADIGINASTILHTGRDEYGTKFPLFFKSFGDYKLPVYVYLTSGSMYLFGKDTLAVRFPSAFFGTLTLVVFYFFLSQLIQISKINLRFNTYIPPLATLLLALSAWHIQFSRGGFEVNHTELNSHQGVSPGME